MEILAIILLLACIYDVIRAVCTIESDRIKNHVPLFYLPFYKYFKGAAYQIVMNMLAAVFFATYLFNCI